MRTLVPVVLVTVVLAGCSGLPAIGSDSDPVTVTPAQVPTDEGEGLPPGVTESGISSVQTLIDAHREALANRSVAINSTYRIVVNNRTVGRSNTTIRIASDRMAVSTVSKHTPSNGTREMWTNETGFYSNSTQNGTNTYRHYNGTRESLPQERSNRRLTMGIKSLLQKASNVSVEPILDDGSPDRYLLQGTRQNDEQSGFSSAYMTIQESNLSAVIDEHGFIRGYEYERRQRNETTTAKIVTTVRFHRDTTPPKRPAWIDEAARATENETTERYRQ
ncbi:hypothetical protein [Halocatena pleomorpha]|uniref:Uncharacterized protein n=1 Tax=Halocatena pleomorpha TaxID=1785090 RepID=A0A3P3R5R9_9EURY|nr:hypothetical protein [Halocatena pleomorpha]RRJ28328.1 hypothetical protein EIK79_15915 [Halocatena pleomorpha]